MGPVVIMAVAILRDSLGRLLTSTYWLATEFLRLDASLMILYSLYCRGRISVYYKNSEN